MNQVTVDLPPRPLADDPERAPTPDVPMPLFAVGVLIVGLLIGAFALRPVQLALGIGYGSELAGAELLVVSIVLILLADRVPMRTGRAMRWAVAMAAASLLVSELAEGLVGYAVAGVVGWPSPVVSLIITPIHASIWGLAGWLMGHTVTSGPGVWWRLALIPLLAEPAGALAALAVQVPQRLVVLTPGNWAQLPREWLPEMLYGAGFGLTIAACMAWARSRRDRSI